jgi:hypothetical protein
MLFRGAFPQPVDVDSAAAKWNKRKRVLKITAKPLKIN